MYQKNQKGKPGTYRYQAPKLKSGSIGPSVTMEDYVGTSSFALCKSGADLKNMKVVD